ncbi:g5715 [Coccomyxa elongata]
MSRRGIARLRTNEAQLKYRALTFHKRTSSQKTAMEPPTNARGTADEDIFDLFGPSPVTSKQTSPPTPTLKLSNGSETQPSTSRPTGSAPVAVPDPFGTALVSGHGERTPALRTARASPEQRMPGSSESSLSQPYEDARSRAYTPETGSLLDFDTPFASPVSPPRAPWRPTPSPLAGDTTHAEGIAGGAAHGGESSTQQWAMLENGALGGSAARDTADVSGRQGSEELSFNDSDASASVLSSLDDLDPLDADMAADMDGDVIGAPSQPSKLSNAGGLNPHQPVVHTSRAGPLEQKKQPNGDQMEHGRDVGETGSSGAASAGNNRKAETVPKATPVQTRGLHAAEVAVSAAAAEVVSTAGASHIAGDAASGSYDHWEALLQNAADLDMLESGQEVVESLEDVAKSGAKLGAQAESAKGGDLLDEWNMQQRQQSEPPAMPVFGGSSSYGSEESARNVKEEADESLPELSGDARFGSEGQSFNRGDLANEQPQQGQQQNAARSVLPHVEGLGAVPDLASTPDLATAASLELEGSDLSLSDLEELQEIEAEMEMPVLAAPHQQHSTSASAEESLEDVQNGTRSLPQQGERFESSQEELPLELSSSFPASLLKPAEAEDVPSVPALASLQQQPKHREVSTASQSKGAVEEQQEAVSEATEDEQLLGDTETSAGGTPDGDVAGQAARVGVHVAGDAAEAEVSTAAGASSTRSVASGSFPGQASLASMASEESSFGDALAQAEALERDLVTGSGVPGLSADDSSPGMPLLNLRRRLARAGDDWPAAGAAGPRGSTIGGSLCARVDALPALSQAATNYRVFGAARAVGCFHGVVALGMSSGVTFVLLPRGLSADAGPDAGPKVMKLGEPRPGDGVEVSALGFSPLGNILGVGHANGDVAFWELKRSGWECAKTVKEAHVTAVVGCAFLEGGNASERSTALTCDSRGRLVYHNVSAYLSITNFLAGRLSKGAQPVLVLDGRQLGPICRCVPLPLPRARAHRSASPDDAARALFFQDGASPFDGMVLLCTARAAYVGRMLPDGRLNILHNIPRPPDAPQGCLPHASWRLSTAPLPNRAMGASLAIAWGRRVLLLDVPLFRQPSDATSPGGQAEAAEEAAAPLAVTVSQRWEAKHGVVGLAWLDGPVLALLLEHGPRTLLHLYNQQGTQILERLELDDSLVGHQHMAANPSAPETAHHSALAASPERIVLLTTQGPRGARVIGWQERLAVLRDLGRWEHALLLALTLLEAAQASAGKPADVRPGRGEMPPRSSGRSADPTAVGDALWVLLLSYLDASLPGGDDGTVGRAAEMAIDVCLGLGREHLLWSEVVPRFASFGAAPRGQLLERLLPRIMAGQIHSLAPEVMQALVEQCAAGGKASAVERCVLRLDLATLDFNQVTRLCRAHRLHSALAFLFNRALGDYTAPAAELLLAFLHAPDESPAESASESTGDSPAASRSAAWGARRATGYKLLVYLHCCLSGRAFPPGMGDVPAEMRAGVKAQLLAFLLYSTLASLQQLAAAFGGDSLDDYGSEEPAEQLLPGPHAALRCLFWLDPGAVLKILRDALEDWDALEADLAEAAGPKMALPAGARSSGRSATQAIVDALVDIVGAKSYDGARMGTKPTRESTEAGTSLVLDFVADFVVAGRAAVEPEVAVRVLQHLAAPDQALAEAEGPPGGRGGSEREDRFVAVLMNSGLAAGGTTPPWVTRDILRFAKGAGYLRAEAQVHHLAGDYASALDCLLQQPQGAAAAFGYIAAALGGGRAAARVPPGRQPALRAAAMAAMPRLVAADVAAAARLVFKDFPGEHAAVVASLAAEPRLQYRYLKGAMEATAEQFTATFDSPTRATAEAAAATAQEALLVQAGAGELYARLLCEFEPAAALPYLQAHDAYRVEAVLPYTQRFGVDDAQAYLLERLGDVQAALGIFCGAAERANAALVARILDGSIPAHFLPAPAQGRTGRAVSGGGNAIGHDTTPLARLFANGSTENRAHVQEPSAASGVPELAAAQAALKGAVALCKRHSRDAAAEVAEELWFGVLQSYVALLRQLRHRERAADGASVPPAGEASTEVHKERLLLAQETVTAFMEDVISHMAGYVPLKAIAERILAAYARDPFGDFKGTLVGLLAAFSYELSILHAAARLTHADAFRTLHALYRERTHPLPAPIAVPSNDDAEEGSASSSAAASPAKLPLSPRPTLSPGASLGAPPRTPRMQVLSNINSGTFAVTGKSIGLMLSPAAEKVRSPPPPILAGGAKSGASPNLAQGGRPGSAEPRPRAVESPGGRGRFGAASRRLAGSSGGTQNFAEPPSPVHRGGVDINYLRMHDVRLG